MKIKKYNIITILKSQLEYGNILKIKIYNGGKNGKSKSIHHDPLPLLQES
jgi:hypothetical protein